MELKIDTGIGNLKNANKKILVIFAILFISNLILYNEIYLHYNHDTIINAPNYLETIINIASVLLLFGFISNRLPQLRNLGESSLYEIGYLLIMGIFSITMHIFESNVPGEYLWEPFLDMFDVLAVVLIIALLLIRLGSFKEVINGKINRKNLAVSLLVFMFLGMFSSIAVDYINGVPSNVRSLVVMVAGLYGGPIIGIPTAVVSALFRYSLGGPTALPCSISTVLSGIVGSTVFMFNGKKIVSVSRAALLMFLFMGLDMLMVLIITPHNLSYPIVNTLYAPMTFVSTIGMILIIMAFDDKKEDETPETDANTIREELDEYRQKIDELERKLDGCTGKKNS